MAYPRFALSRNFKKVTATAGAYTLNSTTWANVDTGLDIVLAAQVGDEIEVGLSASHNNGAVSVGLDVFSVVGGSPVNAWQAGGVSDFGVQAWILYASQDGAVGGSVMKTIVSGDLSSGYVTLRLRYRSGSATNKTLNATTLQPLQFWAKNIGPGDPN